jgi:hypothetical protein
MYTHSHSHTVPRCLCTHIHTHTQYLGVYAHTFTLTHSTQVFMYECSDARCVGRHVIISYTTCSIFPGKFMEEASQSITDHNTWVGYQCRRYR